MKHARLLLCLSLTGCATLRALLSDPAVDEALCRAAVDAALQAASVDAGAPPVATSAPTVTPVVHGLDCTLPQAKCVDAGAGK